MRYTPSAPVVAVLTFWMSTGLAASTVTPGNTAPDVSFTVPVMDAPAWANAAQGSAITSAHAQRIAFSPLMDPPSGRFTRVLTGVICARD